MEEELLFAYGIVDALKQLAVGGVILVFAPAMVGYLYQLQFLLDAAHYGLVLPLNDAVVSNDEHYGGE